MAVGRTDLAHAGLVVADDVERELAGERQQRGVGDHVVDQPEGECFVGEHEVAREAHLPPAADADRLGEQHGEPPARHHSDARVRVAELRVPLATRKSQFDAYSSPPVTATPLIAPIKGLVRVGNGPWTP